MREQIVMSPPMVRALLDGRKTQTRRRAWRDDGSPTRWQRVHHRAGAGEPVELWVREAHAFAGDGRVIYRATAPAHAGVTRWRSPIHMPNRAVRLVAHVTHTKQEPVTAITECDARAEGCDPDATGSYRGGFAAWWEQLHGRGAWRADPEVVVLVFGVAVANVSEPPERG